MSSVVLYRFSGALVESGPLDGRLPPSVDFLDTRGRVFLHVALRSSDGHVILRSFAEAGADEISFPFPSSFRRSQRPGKGSFSLLLRVDDGAICVMDLSFRPLCVFRHRIVPFAPTLTRVMPESSELARLIVLPRPPPGGGQIRVSLAVPSSLLVGAAAAVASAAAVSSSAGPSSPAPGPAVPPPEPECSWSCSLRGLNWRQFYSCSYEARADRDAASASSSSLPPPPFSSSSSSFDSPSTALGAKAAPSPPLLASWEVQDHRSGAVVASVRSPAGHHSASSAEASSAEAPPLASTLMASEAILRWTFTTTQPAAKVDAPAAGGGSEGAAAEPAIPTSAASEPTGAATAPGASAEDVRISLLLEESIGDGGGAVGTQRRLKQLLDSVPMSVWSPMAPKNSGSGDGVRGGDVSDVTSGAMAAAAAAEAQSLLGREGSTSGASGESLDTEGSGTADSRAHSDFVTLISSSMVLDFPFSISAAILLTAPPAPPAAAPASAAESVEAKSQFDAAEGLEILPPAALTIDANPCLLPSAVPIPAPFADLRREDATTRATQAAPPPQNGGSGGSEQFGSPIFSPAVAEAPARFDSPSGQRRPNESATHAVGNDLAALSPAPVPAPPPSLRILPADYPPELILRILAGDMAAISTLAPHELDSWLVWLGHGKAAVKAQRLSTLLVEEQLASSLLGSAGALSPTQERGR